MKLFRKNEPESSSYDPSRFEPVIRSSICTGEKTAGFRDKSTGKVQEIMLIRSGADLEDFKRKYGIRGEIETIY